MDFEWDDAKSELNRHRRGISFTLATEVFAGDRVEWPDDRFDYGEIRIRTVGEVRGEVLHVVYTLRGDVFRIISVRGASRKEPRIWRSRG